MSLFKVDLRYAGLGWKKLHRENNTAHYMVYGPQHTSVLKVSGDFEQEKQNLVNLFRIEQASLEGNFERIARLYKKVENSKLHIERLMTIDSGLPHRCIRMSVTRLI